MKRCPTCGQEIPGPVGRPKTLDDKEVARLKKKGLSGRAIAEKLGVTEGAIRKALKRLKS
jgi:biotin operon repressor